MTRLVKQTLISSFEIYTLRNNVCQLVLQFMQYMHMVIGLRLSQAVLKNRKVMLMTQNDLAKVADLQPL